MTKTPTNDLSDEKRDNKISIITDTATYTVAMI